MQAIVRLFTKLSLYIDSLLNPSNMVISGRCHQCGRCCQQIFIYEDDNIIKSEDDFKRLQKEIPFYQHLHIVGKTLKDQLYFQCDYLVDNKCSIYKTRPAICDQYPSKEMMKNGGVLLPDCGYQIKARKDFDYFFDKKKNIV